METEEGAMNLGDMVQTVGWGATHTHQGIIVKITGDVLEAGRTWREGGQWITILSNGELMTMRPWHLKKVQ